MNAEIDLTGAKLTLRIDETGAQVTMMAAPCSVINPILNTGECATQISLPANGDSLGEKRQKLAPAKPAAQKPDTKINWLHLSDLHQGQPGTDDLYPSVEDAFFKDIPKLIEKQGPIDLIIITGDIAFSGKDDEFTRATEKLQRIYKHLQNHQENKPFLLAVPGNHDLTRPTQTSLALENLDTFDARLQKFFWTQEPGTEKEWEIITQVFSGYTKWRNTPLLPFLPGEPGLLPGDFRATFEKEGRKIGFLGFNSAFLQLTGENYEGKLVIGLKQKSVYGKGRPEAMNDWFQDHDCCFILSHHPCAWLQAASKKSFEQDIYKPLYVKAHLFGHMHECREEHMNIGGGVPKRFFQGNSIFGMETWGENEKRSHGYSLGQLVFSSDGTCLRRWPRILNGLDKRTDYKFDRDSAAMTLDDDGGTPPDFIQKKEFPSNEASGRKHGA